MRFLQIDVFADAPYKGNALAVFPDAPDLTAAQMQAIAAEMKLSETTFVTSYTDDSYDVRIFTPREELPFAGHPTIGTCWAMLDLGLVSGDTIYQVSTAGRTAVTVSGDVLSFERGGTVGDDLEQTDTAIVAKTAKALGLADGDIGFEARELGRSGRLRPARSDAGVEHFLVPLRGVDALRRASPRVDLLDEVSPAGAYVFTAERPGEIRARGFFPNFGTPEDPGTGSAAGPAALLARRRWGTGVDVEVLQGAEIGRPCRMEVHAEEGALRVGGRVVACAAGRFTL